MIFEIDQDGYFVGDHVGDPVDGKLYVETRPDQGMYRAKWDGEKWIETGSSTVSVPKSVTMRQARAALILAGLHDTVYDAINAIEDDQDRALALNEWDRSQVVERNRELVIDLAAAIGLSEAQLDDLFIFAASIP